jgi:hypothetical protein
MSKDNNAVLKTGEAADSVAVKAEQGKTLAMCPDLNQWSDSEMMKRRINLTDESFKFQTKVDKAKRDYEKAVNQLNEAIDSGNPEESAKMTYTVAEKKKVLNDLKQQWRDCTQERLKLEAESANRENARHNTPSVFLADGAE